MTEQQFLIEMDEDLEFPEGTLQRGVVLTDLPLWDSMQQLVFIAKCEEKAGVVVEGTKVSNAKTVDDLLSLVASGLE